jgi:large subunit ribosomal protein L9
MKVILLQDVKSLGKKDAALEVNDGYARNFLLPKGFAVEANSHNMNTLNHKKNAEAKKIEKEKEEAKETAKKLQQTELCIKTKAGENGKLFGSITSKELVQKIKEVHGIEMDKRKIEISESIKTIGTYEVEAKLYTGVVAKFQVKIESE